MASPYKNHREQRTLISVCLVPQRTFKHCAMLIYGDQVSRVLSLSSLSKYGLSLWDFSNSILRNLRGELITYVMKIRV